MLLPNIENDPEDKNNEIFIQLLDENTEDTPATEENEEVDESNDDETMVELVRRSQQQDVSCQNLIQRWRALEEGAEFGPGDKVFHKSYTVHNEHLYRIEEQQAQIIVPQNLHERIVHNYHDTALAGHPGRDETIRAVKEFYYWPGINKYISDYVRQCLICATTKSSARQAEAVQRPHIPSQPFRTISVDVMGPYKKTRRGNRFILVATDIFTKWVEARATETSTTKDIIEFLEHQVFQRFGYPNGIITDGGSAFASNKFERFKKKCKLHHWVSAIYHQQANPVERRNQELKKGLRARLIGKPEEIWDQFLDEVLFTLRTRVNAATGFTPGKALMGYNIPKPGDWDHQMGNENEVNSDKNREDRVQKIVNNHRAYQQNYAPDDVPQVCTYKIGDQVLMRNFKGNKGFDQTWTGPHSITIALSEEVYAITTPDGKEHRVHITDLRPANHINQN